MAAKLFAYGTLAPGESNHGLVECLSGAWQRATVKGFIHGDGWGHCHGYPAIIPSRLGGPVSGWMLESGDLEACWPRLDAFEGPCYERAGVFITTEDGRRHRAHAYILAGAERREDIVMGIWTKP